MSYRRKRGPRHYGDASVDFQGTEQVYIKPAIYESITHRLSQPTFGYEPHLIKEDEITPGIPRKEYEDRRHRLFVKLPIDSCLILASNPEPRFNHDAKHSFRQNADFLYFTGLQEANSMAIFTKDAAGNCHFILFVQKEFKNRDITWHGDKCGLKEAITVKMKFFKFLLSHFLKKYKYFQSILVRIKAMNL